jgi:hypothetical protein
VDGSRAHIARFHADEAELGKLAAHWLTVDSTETNDAFGPPGVFLRMVVVHLSHAHEDFVRPAPWLQLWLV